MFEDLEPEYARFVGPAVLENIELQENEKSAIEKLEGEVYGDGVVFDYDSFLDEVGSEDGFRWREQTNTEYIAVAETEEELMETVKTYVEENRTFITSDDPSSPIGTSSRY
jgi:hypothetical protein